MPNPVAIQNKTIRILFLTSIISVMFGTILFCTYVLLLQKKTTNIYEFDETTKPPDPSNYTSVSYTDNVRPSLLILSSCLVFVSMFCVVYILTKFVNVFSSSSKPIVNYLLLVLIVLTNIVILACNGWYIFIKPPTPLPNNSCTDPLKFKNSDGECVCVGNLTDSSKGCTCAPGSHRKNSSPFQCTNSCTKDEECGNSSFCNLVTNFCCLPGQNPCGLQCCGSKETCFGDPLKENAVCCDQPLCATATGAVCCGATQKCVDDPDDPNAKICQDYCGKNLLCRQDQKCFSMTGDEESIKQYTETLIDSGDVTSDQVEITGSGKNTTLSCCTTPSMCEFTAEPQYFPTIVKARGPRLDYYPCLISEKITKLAPLPPDVDPSKFQTPYDLNVCIPKPPADPNDIRPSNDDYFECFQRIRPADGSKVDASKCESKNDPNNPKCTLVNILHEDYSNPSRQDMIYRTIAVNTFNLQNPNDPNYRAYQGSYCGHPAYRIINNTVSESCSKEEAALACAQMGAYADSKYVAYGEAPNPYGGKPRRYCNTLFECQDFSNENQKRFVNSTNKDGEGKYFKSFKFGDIEKTFQTLNNESSALKENDLFYGETNHFVYETTCPPNMQPVDPIYFPSGCTPGDITCDYKNCPDDLKYIQSKGKKVNNDFYYDTNVCTKQGHIHRVSSETGGKYFSIQIPKEHPNDFRYIDMYPNNSCNSTTVPSPNCYTAIQWQQVMTDYQFSLPLTDDIKNTIINSDDGHGYKLFVPTYNINMGNCSSQHGGILSKEEISNAGGGQCNWSAHLGIGAANCGRALPNFFRIVRVSVKGNLDDPNTVTITPSLGGTYTIRDNDYIIILGDDGYGGPNHDGLFTGLGSWCNGEWAPCLRKENAYIPSKKDDDGNYVPNWESPDIFISSDHALFVITIEDDPYIYEDLFNPAYPIKYLRRERAFSLKKAAGPFKGQYVKIGEAKNCGSCEGTIRSMQFQNGKPDDFMKTCTFVLSDNETVVPPKADGIYKPTNICKVK